MKITTTPLRIALLAAGLPFSIGTVFAAANDVDEVVVTATKREELLKDVAMSITAVTAADLELRHDSGLQDLTEQVPGLSLQSIDAGKTRIVIRGQNVGSVGATVATTIDDIPFFMSSAQSNGAFFSANIDSFDLARIEVLRGPQGTLYGASAEGGLIKYVTNRPDPTKFDGAFRVGMLSTSGGDSKGFAKGMINVPFWDGKAALRVVAFSNETPGYVDNPLTGAKNINGVKVQGGRASLLLQPSDALSIRATVFAQKTKADNNNNVEVVGAALTPAAPPNNKFDAIDGMSQGTLWNFSNDIDLKVGALTIDYDFGDMTLTSATSYGKNDLVFSSDISNANLAAGLSYGDFFGGAVYGQPAGVLLTGNETNFVHKFNQEIRLSSNKRGEDSKLDWQVGGFFTRESVALIQPYVARNKTTLAVLAPPVGDANISANYKERSAFADATYHFTDSFDVQAGVRYTKVDQQQQVVLGCCIIYGPGTTYPVRDSAESKTTWSLAPRWQIGEDTLLYARLATGFRPGGPNFPTPPLPDPPNFLPDSTKNYEVGFRTQLADGKISIDVAVFKIDWTDVQILGLIPTENGPIGVNGNSGSATSQGVEWNLAWRPTDYLRIGYLGAYTDAKLKTDAAGLGAFKGDELPYVPRTSSTLNVDFNGTVAGKAVFGGFSVNSVGKRYTGFSPSVAVTEPHVALPSYTTLNAQLGVDFGGRYTLEVFAQNLGNETGILDYGNNGSRLQRGYAVFTAPRTVGVQFGAKF